MRDHLNQPYHDVELIILSPISSLLSNLFIRSDVGFMQI
jgi:hypothetical protein